MANDKDGYESFEINDFDLDSALNPGQKRHRLSKHQQIYGIWADKEDSDEEDRRAGPSLSKKRPNYAAPVSFVSGGNTHRKETIEKESKNDNDCDPLELRPHLERTIRPTQKQRQHSKVQEMAGMRGPAFFADSSNVTTDWQKHSKSSVLMNMMKSMGYTPGQGLGAKGQGIVEPVQIAMRPGRAAVGAYGREAKGQKFGESAADAQKRDHEGNDEAQQEGDQQTEKGHWKRNGSQKKTNWRYRTVDEVLQDGGQLKKRIFGAGSNVDRSTKVIDMTGPEQRIYSGYDAFSSKSLLSVIEPERPSFDIPELGHNLNLLVDLTEEEIIRTDRFR